MVFHFSSWSRIPLPPYQGDLIRKPIWSEEDAEGKVRLTEIIDMDIILDRTLDTSHAIIYRKH